MNVINAIEFFSGIGGMHYALKNTSANINVLAAFDISPLANKCYQHNFKISPIQTGIDNLSIEKLSKFKDCNLWMISPPCQPYSRQGKMLDLEDQRAKGFLHLIELLSQIDIPPKYIFLENVVNFEKSKTRDIFIEKLLFLGYEYKEWILSPLQFGIPNDRPRYYLTAELTKCRGQRCEVPVSVYTQEWHEIVPQNPLSAYMDKNPCIEELNIPCEFLEKRKFININSISNYSSTRSSCFTKAYGHHGIHSGSFLQTKDFDLERNIHILDNPQLANQTLGLRMFSPTEMARLHAFPVDSGEFQFPNDMNIQQRWKVVGNSLNVLVVSQLLENLLIKQD